MNMLRSSCILVFMVTCMVNSTHAPQQQPNVSVSVSPKKDNSTDVDYDKVLHQWMLSMADAMYLVREKYFKKIDPLESFKKSINAFVSLDPHSGFLDPKTYKEIVDSMQGEFFGIGILVNYMKETDDEFLTIIDTIPAGPADKIGIKPGDKIVQIEEEPVKGMTVEEAISKLKGKRNTTVHIKVVRPDSSKLIPFDIVRDVVKEQQALSYHFPDHNIYYLGLTTFSENSTKQIEELMKKLQKDKAKGLILDLRNNTGGLLNSVIDIAGLFLPKGSTVVLTKNRDLQVTETAKTTREPLTNASTPIFILINNFTASAAEILAGCLQYHSEEFSKKNDQHKKLDVFLVGTKTFGKGSVQEVIPISNDSALKLTIALYYLPNNESIQGVGIAPDFVIDQKLPLTAETTWFNTYFGRESSLKNSIKNESEEKNQQEKNDKKPKIEKKDKTWQERKQEQISGDHQILSTIRLIEMFDLTKKAYPKMHQRKETIDFLKKAYSPDNSLTMTPITDDN
jgi:carboxyl-terminal processing protease